MKVSPSWVFEGKAGNIPMNKGGNNLCPPRPHSRGIELPGEEAPERTPQGLGVGRLHQGRAGHPLALFRNLGVCGGRKRITQPQHVTSGRRSQVGRHPSRKGCGSRASGPPRGKRRACGPGPRGPRPRDFEGEEPRPGQFRVPKGVRVSARQRAGGPSTARPVASLPAPRLPAEAAAAMLWG